MARMFLLARKTLTPSGNPFTLMQFVTAANTRVALSSIEIEPLGSTGASAQLEFELAKATDSNGLANDTTATLIAVDPAHSESHQLQIWTRSTGEPTLDATGTRYRFAVHQQASRLWVPQNQYKEIIMAGGEKWVLRQTGGPNVALNIVANLEE